MEKYQIIFLITFHENIENIKYQIENIKKFNKNCIIIYNNGSKEDHSSLNGPDVIFVPRKSNDFCWGRTIIPLHLELYNYMVENNIESEYVMMLSSNQMFIKHDFYDFCKDYLYGYFDRPCETAYSDAIRTSTSHKFADLIGKMHFNKQSNHDSMFFKYDVFKSLMTFFHSYDADVSGTHQEEYLYVAYLKKEYGEDKAAKFEQYSYWNRDWKKGSKIYLDELKECLKQNFYVVKRVERDYNDVKKFIMEL